MGEMMEIAFLIGGILIGVIGALTVRNTLKLREKVTVSEPSEEQKRQEEQFQAMLDYKG
jgi:hypothetical protein